ncbi:MAG: hypothetical protein M3O61_05055 [Gemmatimonadota bacterium]|nr:hypothetical protein [Gemmatimonadota bacterium]
MRKQIIPVLIMTIGPSLGVWNSADAQRADPEPTARLEMPTKGTIMRGPAPTKGTILRVPAPPAIPDFTCSANGVYYYKKGFTFTTSEYVIDNGEVLTMHPFAKHPDLDINVWLKNAGGKEGVVRTWTTTIMQNGLKVRTFSHQGEEPYSLTPGDAVLADFYRFSDASFIPLTAGDNRIEVHTIIAPLQGEANFTNNSCSTSFTIRKP